MFDVHNISAEVLFLENYLNVYVPIFNTAVQRKNTRSVNGQSYESCILMYKLISEGRGFWADLKKRDYGNKDNNNMILM